MPSRVTSAAIVGLAAQAVEVEADCSTGLPNFTIVGLPDASVQEARERVRSAMRHAGLAFPRGRVTVNLAPADLKKEGGGYDLPICLAILLASEGFDPSALEGTIVVGELGLHGDVRSVTGALSTAILAQAERMRALFVPSANAAEASVVSGAPIIPVQTLLQLVRHIRGEEIIAPLRGGPVVAADRTDELDFSNVHGQEQAKRALEVAAAGGHNVLFTGPPGAGKTMLARAFPSILPTMDEPEAIEVTQIYSVAGLLKPGASLLTTRPFRTPHHTSSAVALVGGGTNPKPGEVTLAHRGVLFLDELPEFSRSVLESLRQPLEDGTVTVSRASGTVRFPASFMLLASQNPCPCGFSGDPHRRCTCQPGQIMKYGKRISGPLKDRIDLHLSVPSVTLRELTGPAGESSAAIRARVEAARQRQAERFSDRSTRTNSAIRPQDIKRYCTIDPAGRRLLERAVDTFHLSARGFHRLLKVSRTIADLEGVEMIGSGHVAEAIQYREQPTKT